MTEKLAYNGPSTAEFENGETYSVIWGTHQGFVEAWVGNGAKHKYASLKLFLQYWRPADAQGLARAEHGMVS
ncbi:hypothetical protein D0N36_19245 [Hymenobacter lapidiphilus]|uniref:hypothetical protein n=1 Tax=Hymenobacter sp. CCM 8763 TaxID=2303334 RepID=UPI000E341EB9|nr:hypothetical protein [Hymenobacter sp. CCM 8763]RFP63477.1 hypothetical protein D0N36_19245 [Hymenobacter sp. CCM 8763]